MKPITFTQLDNVLSLFQTSSSTGEISAQTGISKLKIASLAKEVVPDTENHQAGCLKKLSATDEHAVIKQVTTGRAENAAQVARNINPLLSQPVSTQTIKNTLHKANIDTRKKQKKPRLTPAQKKAHLIFAQKYKDWTVDDWKRVIWSDETKINRFGSDGQQYVWKRKGEPLGREASGRQ